MVGIGIYKYLKVIGLKNKLRFFCLLNDGKITEIFYPINKVCIEFEKSGKSSFIVPVEIPLTPLPRGTFLTGAGLLNRAFSLAEKRQSLLKHTNHSNQHKSPFKGGQGDFSQPSLISICDLTGFPFDNPPCQGGFTANGING